MFSKYFKLRFAVLIITGFLASCQKSDNSDGDKKTEPPKTAEETPPPPQEKPPVTPPVTDDNIKLTAETPSIQKMLIDKKCLSCHSVATRENRNISLADVLKVTDLTPQPVGTRIIIKAGCPDQSFFMSVLKHGTMPLGPEKVVGEDLKVVSDWIKSLKPGRIDCSDEPSDD